MMTQLLSPSTRGLKYNQGKPRIALISPSLVCELGKVLQYGEQKYTTEEESGARNWEKGIPYDEIFDSAQRHLWAWWDGEDIDPESGLSHLSHAACNLMFLIHFHYDYSRYVHLDNRPLCQLQS